MRIQHPTISSLVQTSQAQQTKQISNFLNQNTAFGEKLSKQLDFCKAGVP